jgi:hypothetical protein
MGGKAQTTDCSSSVRREGRVNRAVSDHLPPPLSLIVSLAGELQSW